MASTPIIRSPMKPAKKGEAPTIEWARWVESTLRRLIDVPPPRNRPITGGSADRPPFWTEISQVPESDPAEYQVTVTLGFLTYQNANQPAVESEQGVTGYITPFINGVSMEDEEVGPLELPDVASWVYLRVKTDADGCPKFSESEPPVTIEAFDAMQESVHHVRPSPSGGEEEGDYFFLILQTESNEATPTPAPRVVRRITGNRELPNQLVEIANIGGKREWYEGYDPDEDKHQLRTAEQLESRGEPIIKPLASGEEEGETIKWKTIAERASSPQIQVTTEEDGEVVQIRGNGFDQSFGGIVKALSVNDGLVTGFTELTDAWWGVVRWYYEGIGDSDLEMELEFQNGILVGVTGGIVNFGTGTEADPGDVTFATADTV